MGSTKKVADRDCWTGGGSSTGCKVQPKRAGAEQRENHITLRHARQRDPGPHTTAILILRDRGILDESQQPVPTRLSPPVHHSPLTLSASSNATLQVAKLLFFFPSFHPLLEYRVLFPTCVFFYLFLNHLYQSRRRI